ncbi:hypothetical protein NDN08_002563 [Rhodosorus marinus]|uniref:SH2 domain-containing protein n=1 Tax=Rhodosorus marinus TaxID=101924 RepID=A0AAV8UU57_9RHOD|nr:hypothetical protein NDN08_002563 [Rhodosorus marinus]
MEMGERWVEKGFWESGQYVDPEKGKVVSAVKDRGTLVLRSSSTGRLVYVCKYSLRLGKQKDPPKGPRKYKRRGRCNCNCLLELRYFTSEYMKSMNSVPSKRAFLIRVFGKLPDENLRKGWYAVRANPYHTGHSWPDQTPPKVQSVRELPPLGPVGFESLSSLRGMGLRNGVGGKDVSQSSSLVLQSPIAIMTTRIIEAEAYELGDLVRNLYMRTNEQIRERLKSFIMKMREDAEIPAIRAIP